MTRGFDDLTLTFYETYWGAESKYPQNLTLYSVCWTCPDDSKKV